MNLTEKYMLRLDVKDSQSFDNATKTIDNIDKTPDEYSTMHKKCLDALCQKYEPGTFEYIRNNRPKLFKQLQGLEDRLDELWDKGIVEFKAALTKYYHHNLMLIRVTREFKSHSPPVSRKEVKQEQQQLF
ncbi:MAG: hypothetical protein ACUZ8H_04750 [Candidatus Anammoxibacter sp.]